MGFQMNQGFNRINDSTESVIRRNFTTRRITPKETVVWISKSTSTPPKDHGGLRQRTLKFSSSKTRMQCPFHPIDRRDNDTSSFYHKTNKPRCIEDYANVLNWPNHQNSKQNSIKERIDEAWNSCTNRTSASKKFNWRIPPMHNEDHPRAAWTYLISFKYRPMRR